MSENENWKAALVNFLDALTDLTRIGISALKDELAKKERGVPFVPPHRR